jgi:hypothetical protein
LAHRGFQFPHDLRRFRVSGVESSVDLGRLAEVAPTNNFACDSTLGKRWQAVFSGLIS